jgi:N-acetylglucosaminyldiphosphoundecaprenol N-acetyl-beta-D-mannosaminyltransferase
MEYDQSKVLSRQSDDTGPGASGVSAAKIRPADGHRVQMLGGQIDLLTPDLVLAYLAECAAAGQQTVIGNHNLHSLYLLPRTPGMRALYDLVDVVQLDSTPLVLFGKLLKLPIGRQHRSTYLDWRDAFWSLADQKGWRVLYVGGADGVATTAAERLKVRYPGVTIEGLTGYFDVTPGSEVNRAVLQAIAAFKPHVVMVGMGMPRQEIWIAENLHDLPHCPILPVGAAFDYEAGMQKAAPRWMGKMGVEWLFRLVVDPKRLFTRYCVEPWFLIGPALKDLRTAQRR